MVGHWPMGVGNLEKGPCFTTPGDSGFWLILGFLVKVLSCAGVSGALYLLHGAVPRNERATMPTLQNILQSYVGSVAQHADVCQAARALGHDVTKQYSAICCEVCGTNLEYFGALVLGERTSVGLGNSEYVALQNCGQTGILLTAGCSFANGETTLWGLGECGGCQCDAPNNNHWD